MYFNFWHLTRLFRFLTVKFGKQFCLGYYLYLLFFIAFHLFIYIICLYNLYQKSAQYKERSYKTEVNAKEYYFFGTQSIMLLAKYIKSNWTFLKLSGILVLLNLLRKIKHRNISFLIYLQIPQIIVRLFSCLYR